ncbi:general transcription factor 3C polypeptide 1 isoform X2 [Trichomycterus rosablanca]|uniref:general transcription factor 3C polypeptide 1 isoform X2 n=1 Tax=Trichomycterus rosablanca TaxID=2290929 RepID=UPI002F359137
MDALEMTLDEVALEGLDGITIPSLWIRLEDRQPRFPRSLDTLTKEYLFKYLVSHEEVSFHLLPQNREAVILYDRFSDIDPETGIQELRRSVSQQQDVYPVSVIKDDPQGVQGSCLYYRERKDVGALIRTETRAPKLTLQGALKKWGNKLVLVASRHIRSRALIGSEGNPELKLSDPSYCILERLGRARWQGEVQRDLHNCAFRLDAGKIHYLRKSLDKNGLITMQSQVVRLPSGAQQHSILLLLKRFHVDRRSKYDILMELTSNILSEMPNHIGIMIKLRDQLHVCERTFKKMYQYMLAAKMVSVVTLPLQELNPDAGPCKTKKGTDVRVRCLKLLKPYSRNKVEDGDEEDEDGDGPARRSVQPQARDLERDLLTQAYEIVVTTGSKGISQSELRTRLNVGKLESRMICKVLDRNKMIKGFMEDEGRQRTTKYISKLFVEQSKLNLDFTKERERSEKLRAPQGATPGPPPDTQEPEEEEEAPPKGRKQQRKSTGRNKAAKKGTKRKAKKSPPRHSTPLRKKPGRPRSSRKSSTLADLGEAQDSLLTQDGPADHTPSIISQSQTADDSMTVIEEVVSKPEEMLKKRREEIHQTYRLLKRKNIIIEAVRNLKVIEGLYTLQKKLMDEEKLDGVNTKVCKKSILRLTRTLARDGFLKLYRTTVIQDGVSKKVEFVVHPSVTPDDPLVRSAIEQVRFKISSSSSVHRLKVEEKRKSSSQDGTDAGSQLNVSGLQALEVQTGPKEEKFKPVIVPGLSRALGYQPKMSRLQVVHAFLWYLIYGHPLNAAPDNDPKPAPPDPQTDPGVQDVPQSLGAELNPDQEDAGSAAPTSGGQEQFKVYVNEESWRRFIPPLPVHRGFGNGWAFMSDVMISLPLSVYVQIIQIGYKVDGLKGYLHDPVKQHYLIRFLPAQMKRQILHRRKYYFSFFENLQKLCYMGLLQFGPSVKFMEKDQCFIFLKKRATIVDTTACEPHYNLAVGTRPFERSHYTFNTNQDVKNYWFDLQCVCLNTPLGVIRPRVRTGEDDGEGEAPDVPVSSIRYEKLAYTLQGSSEVVDEGVVPGDGQGAGGLDSSFFSHLKRNWFWTTHLLDKPKQPGESRTVRLRNLLSKHPLPKSVCAAVQNEGPGAAPVFKEEEVEVRVEPSSRNQQVRGGKKQKRKRQKKDTPPKPPKKRRKVASVRKRTRCQDETDRNALMRMTRQRVTWTHLEDGVLMLCRVTSHFLNRKIKKPFVGWNVVRDILHRDLELSLDKTSLAVGRRSRYIMKNPQTQLNYRICLAEVYQDKTLVDEFMNRSNNYTDQNVCAEEFNEFVKMLKAKLSSSYGPSDVIIPDSKEELFNRFKLYTIGEEAAPSTDLLNSVEDVHPLVLNNLIQSTLVLSNSQMKPSRAFQSFSLYSKYKQEVLLQVFLACKKLRLVNRRRANKFIGPKKNRAVPCLPMSYQLSQLYYRYFTWRFPSTMHNEVYDLLEALRQRGTADRPSAFYFQPGGGGDAEGTHQNLGASGEPQSSEGRPDVSEMLPFPMDAPGGATACCLTLMSLGMMSVDVSIPQQIVVVDSTLVDNEVVKSFARELDEEDEDEGGARFEVKARQASHTNYLLMKGYFVPGIISLRNITSTEHIAVNACVLHVRLRNTRSHTLFTPGDGVFSPAPAPPASLSRMFDRRRACGRSFPEECAAQLGYTRQDVKAVRGLTVAVETSAELGVDLRDLCGAHAHLEQVLEGRSRNLQQYIQDLLDREEMVEVGAVSRRLVCMRFAAPWLLHCPKVFSSQDATSTPEAPPTSNNTACDAPPTSSDAVPEAPPTSDKPPLKRPLDHVDDDDVAPPTKRPNVETVATETTAPTGESSMEVGVDDNPPDVPPSFKEETGCSDKVQGSVLNSSSLMPGEEGTGARTEDETLAFVARPWRIVDGSLNAPVCKGMLEALLSHVMTHPGVPEPALLQHYSGVLQPLLILDLLEVLLELGCVRKSFTVTPPKPSLFSRPCLPRLREQGGVSVLDQVVAFYEPTVDCSVRLARLLPHQNNWNRWVQLCVR